MNIDGRNALACTKSIDEIKKHYDLNKFFRHKLPHYKTQAAR